MGLSREVDDRVRPGDDAVDQIGVSDIALDDGQARGELGGNVSQGRAVARIGELIEDDDVDIRMILKERVNEIRSDESGTAGTTIFMRSSPLRARGVRGCYSPDS